MAGNRFSKKTSDRTISRLNKKFRIKKKLSGSVERPRLTVYRSLGAISAQIVDDTQGSTLVSCTTLKLDIKKKTNTDAARAVGLEIAKLALAKKIENVVFDRNGYLFHGRIKALADAAREGGLKF